MSSRRYNGLGSSPLFSTASSSTGVSATNTGITGNSACVMFGFFYFTAAGTICSMGATAGTHTGMQLRCTSSTAVDLNISGIGSIPYTSGGSLFNAWHSILAYKAAGSSSYLLYVDGLARNGGGTGTPNWTDSPFYVGTIQNGTVPANGNLSVCGIFNATLTDAQILALHNKLERPSVAAKVFSRMTTGTGQTAPDVSGNGNDITFTGISWSANMIPFGKRAQSTARVQTSGRIQVSNRVAV